MKQFFSSLMFLFFTALAWAQSPQSINYQGVARNASGVPYAGQQISVRLSIRTGAANGTVEYSETRNVETNQFGLFNVQIGSAGATNVQGDFATINWASGTKFLQTEISVNAQPFVSLGTTQMMSVPYSIHSQQSKGLVLPFDTTVSINDANVFTLKNTAPGFYYTMALQSVNGVALYASSEKNAGLRATSHAKKSDGISGHATADSSNGVYGSMGFEAKGGIGVYGEGWLDNVGVKGKSINKAGVQGFSTYNYGVYGESRDFPGIQGVSSKMPGVIGETNTGIGMIGRSTEGEGGVLGLGGEYTTNRQYGVKGEGYNFSTGVLARAAHTTATALEVDGKLKITNNNSFAGAGKVLTSDAQGFATWQSPTPVAFRASGLRGNVNQAIPNGESKRVNFFQEARYNVGNAYDAENSIFFVPMAGVYHLFAQIDWYSSSPYTVLELKMLRAGTVTTIAQTYWGPTGSSGVASSPIVTTDIALQPNDAIWVEVFHSADNSGPRQLINSGFRCWFTGHIITKL